MLKKPNSEGIKLILGLFFGCISLNVMKKGESNSKATFKKNASAVNTSNQENSSAN